jgi:hypothetical protein
MSRSAHEGVIVTPRTMRIDIAELRRHLARFGDEIERLVFVAEPTSDPAVQRLVLAMLERFRSEDADALIAIVPVAEAVKQVRDGVVRAGLDRTNIVAVAGPEIVSRAALVSELDGPDLEPQIDPAALVARNGGRVALYDLSAIRSHR